MSEKKSDKKKQDCQPIEFDEHPSVPQQHDVMCGRGGQSNNHPGNEWFRRLVRSNRALYKSCPKHTKLLVAKAIVQAVHQQDPPGRFIKVARGDGTSPESVWKPITYSQAVAKTSQALREKDASSRKRKIDDCADMAEIISANKAKISLRGSIENKSPLQIAKETTELLQSESRFDQAGKKFSTLTDVAIKSATSKTPLTPSPFMKNSPNGMVPSRINERQSTAFPPMPSTTSSRIATSWWSNIGSEPKENIVTPGLASYVNQQRSNKRSKVQYREDTKAGTPSQHPPPPSTGEHRTSFFGILNCSGVFGTANKGCTKPSNTASGTTTTSEVAHLPTFQRGLSRGLSSMFGLSVEKTQNDRFQDDGEPAPPPSFQRRLSRGISSMFGLSLDKAQTDRFQDTTPLPNFQRGISRGLSRGISGMFGFSRQPIANSQAQDNGQTSHRTNDSSNDNFALPPPPTRQLTTQVSAWLTSFHPTETTELETMSSSKAENAKRYNNNDPVLSRGISSSIYGEPLPPPVGSSETGVSDNPSLARSISSAVYGLRDSPSLLLTSLKSGVSSMFWNLDDTTLKKAVNQPSSEKDGVNGNATLGKGIESRGCLLDDTEDTPMEMQLRDGGNSRTLDKKLANEKRGCLLDDLDDNELQQQLRLAI